MNTVRLSTLSLSLAVVVVTLGYATSAFAGKKCDAGPEHPSCKDGDNGEISAVYTAELTMGGFIFGPVDVTPSKRGNSYHSEETLKMSRPPDDATPDDATPDQMVWDEVFSWCMDLLTTNPPVSVAVADNWTIDNSGGNKAGTVGSDIRIRFKDVVATEPPGSPDVDISFDLSGVILAADGPFLPVDINNPSSFTLTQFVIFGDAKKGQSCRSGVQDLQVHSVLKITLTQ